MNVLLVWVLSDWINSAVPSCAFFLPKASKLTKQIIILEEKKQSQEEQIRDYQKQLKALHTTCEELKAKLDSRIAAEEHFALVNDLKRWVCIWCKRNSSTEHSREHILICMHRSVGRNVLVIFCILVVVSTHEEVSVFSKYCLDFYRRLKL